MHSLQETPYSEPFFFKKPLNAKSIEVSKIMFSVHSGIKLETNYSKTPRKCVNILPLSKKELLNNGQRSSHKGN